MDLGRSTMQMHACESPRNGGHASTSTMHAAGPPPQQRSKRTELGTASSSSSKSSSTSSSSSTASACGWKRAEQSGRLPVAERLADSTA